MDDMEEKSTEENSCGCGNSCGKFRWLWAVLAMALAVVVLGKLARNGPSSCAGGFCPFPAAAADSKAAPAASK